LVKPKAKTVRDKDIYRKFEAVRTALNSLQSEWHSVRSQELIMAKMSADMAGTVDRFSGVKSVESDQGLAKSKAELKIMEAIRPKLYETMDVINEATTFYTTPPKAVAPPKAKK
jgi:hypothetical protein